MASASCLYNNIYIYDQLVKHFHLILLCCPICVLSLGSNTLMLANVANTIELANVVWIYVVIFSVCVCLRMVVFRFVEYSL